MMADFVLAVVDTNVPLCANGKSHVSAECVRSCISEVRRMQKNGCIVLDDGWKIVREYKNKLSPSGQPGIGDAFLKWVLTNIKNSERCQLVSLTPRPGQEYCFQEFPDEPGLEDFDPSDRKFVAVAAAHPERPPILQAADSKWWGWRKVLHGAGIKVAFLCQDDIREKYHKKIKDHDPD